jgi:ammonia channel protein AmtB
MVDSTITDDQRQSFQRRLLGGFVLLVGASGGMVAVQAQASTIEIAAAVLIGLVFGGLLAWYLIRVGREYKRKA